MFIQENAFQKLSEKWRPFCIGIKVLMIRLSTGILEMSVVIIDHIFMNIFFSTLPVLCVVNILTKKMSFHRTHDSVINYLKSESQKCYTVITSFWENQSCILLQSGQWSQHKRDKKSSENRFWITPICKYIQQIEQLWVKKALCVDRIR